MNEDREERVREHIHWTNVLYHYHEDDKYIRVVDLIQIALYLRSDDTEEPSYSEVIRLLFSGSRTWPDWSWDLIERELFDGGAPEGATFGFGDSDG